MIVIDKDSIAVMALSSRGRVSYDSDEQLLVKYRGALAVGFIISSNPEESVREMVVISTANRPLYIKVKLDTCTEMEPSLHNTITCYHGNSDWDKHFGFLLLADLKKNKTNLVNFFKRKEVAAIGVRYKLYNRLDLIRSLKGKTPEDANLIINVVD